MARRTGKNGDAEGFGYLIIACGVLLFIPFLVVSFTSFGKLKREYLESQTAQRVMDIRRLGGTLVLGGFVCAVGAFFIYNAVIEMKKTGIALNPMLIAILLSALVIIIGYYAARHLSVLYLGIIADKANDTFAFPYDMQSYGIGDYFSLRFLKDYCNIDTVPLSAIKKMTRGRGKELYVHGDFGSRGIIMSSKQKRDECLAMIQSISGKKGLLIAEVEGF